MPQKKDLLTKIFVGLKVDSRLHVHLKEHQGWKEDRIDVLQDKLLIHIEHYKKKEYIGCYLPEKIEKLDDIKRVKERIKELLKNYDVLDDIEDAKFYLFTKLFIP